VKVSVIIPTFNRSHTVKDAVESVLAQTYSNFELIVIDDGSSDNTKDVLADYISNNQIRYLYQDNQGVSKARNVAVANSDGEWLSFLDSDDRWLPNKLEKQIELLKAQPDKKLVHGEEIWIRRGKRVNPRLKHQKSGGDIFSRSLELCLISPSAVMLSRELFDEMGGFREDFVVCEDYDLWLKITSLNEVAFVREPIIEKFGGHEDQLSAKYFAMDYWRVKSIAWILENRKLSEHKRLRAIKVLQQKTDVLIAGYLKHENFENLNEVRSLKDKFTLT
jgi:glycosyltransferase involved in cell wall biosynthesis